MKKLIFILACITPLIAYAAPKSKAPAPDKSSIDYETEYQINRTILNYCIHTFVATTDDGISDVQTIAKAARVNCKEDFKKTLIYFCKSTKGVYCESNSFLNNLLNSDELLYSTFVIPVLKERRDKNKTDMP